MTKRIFSLLLIAVIFLTGCTAAPDDGKTHIVVTTTMLCDLVSELGGERVSVTGLMGPGTDPHLYQASAGDVISMSRADIVIYNGLHLEGKLGDIFSSLDSCGKTVICASDGISPEKLIITDSEVYDPHIWFDISLWHDAAVHITDCLCSAEPQNAEYFRNNLESYSSELRKLETYVRSRISEIPESARVLITAHDAFSYMGKAYGLEVIGLQGIATDSEAGTYDISKLADYICNNRINAIFAEASVSKKSMQALQAAVHSRGFSVSVGGELYSDSLNSDGNYIMTFRSNIDTIADALKGGA